MKKGEIKFVETVVNFCGGCNSTVKLQKFVAVDEGETLESAWIKRYENKDDELFKRTRLMGFCQCGNVYLFKQKS